MDLSSSITGLVLSIPHDGGVEISISAVSGAREPTHQGGGLAEADKLQQKSLCKTTKISMSVTP